MSTPGELRQARQEAEAAGIDPARFEEAFAAFSDRVRELEDVADELRAELRALRAGRTAPAPAPVAVEDERWPVEGDPDTAADWVAAVPAPLVRPRAVPRLALEGVFLLLVALFAGLADLAVEWIVLIMVGAWALVVLGEWAAAARRARWRLDEVAPALGDPGDATGPWDMPVVEATVVDPGPESESRTVVTRLPEPEAPEEPAGPKETVEPEESEDEPVGEAEQDEEPKAAAAAVAPQRRRFSLRRKAPAEAAPGEPSDASADPWET
jgi:hypothetical protein